ncbi:hypothetical protein KKG83_07995 [Candidatus Micrarchaeota archaeon]|nr:hypothetical protein [Candidatus Micrarchaeota archaeon]
MPVEKRIFLKRRPSWGRTQARLRKERKTDRFISSIWHFSKKLDKQHPVSEKRGSKRSSQEERNNLIQQQKMARFLFNLGLKECKFSAETNNKMRHLFSILSRRINPESHKKGVFIVSKKTVEQEQALAEEIGERNLSKFYVEFSQMCFDFGIVQLGASLARGGVGGEHTIINASHKVASLMQRVLPEDY